MGRPKEIMMEEFEFNTTVNALIDDEWDLIFASKTEMILTGKGERAQ